MDDRPETGSPRPGRRRIAAAALRALPALLIAAAIWFWFDLGRRHCDERVRSWSLDLAGALARGDDRLPAPATISEWIEPTLHTWLGDSPRPDVQVRFEPADPEIDSLSPAVAWTEGDGTVLALRCRCDGDLIEVVGIERRERR